MFILIAVVILLRGCQVWIFACILIYLLEMLKGVITRLLLRFVVILSFSLWVISIVTQDSSIQTPLDISLMSSGDTRSSSVNPHCFAKVHLNLALILCHNFPVLIRKFSLTFIIYVMYGVWFLPYTLTTFLRGGLDKVSELVITHFW